MIVTDGLVDTACPKYNVRWLVMFDATWNWDIRVARSTVPLGFSSSIIVNRSWFVDSTSEDNFCDSAEGNAEVSHDLVLIHKRREIPPSILLFDAVLTHLITYSRVRVIVWAAIVIKVDSVSILLEYSLRARTMGFVTCFVICSFLCLIFLNSLGSPQLVNSGSQSYGDAIH